jgi:hypothetical protein
MPHDPRFEAASFACPRCNTLAQQDWGALEVYDEMSGQWGQASDEPFGRVESPARWSLSTCFACKHGSVWRRGELIYPANAKSGPAPAVDMPDLVRELFEEARAVTPLSRRAGAALARAALERLLRDLDPDAPRGTKLDGFIARLRTRVSTPLLKLLTPLRHIGNQSLHVADAPDGLVALYLNSADDELVDLIFAAINSLVDELITRPRVVSELYDQLPPGVREAAERRAEQP